MNLCGRTKKKLELHLHRHLEKKGGPPDIGKKKKKKRKNNIEALNLREPPGGASCEGGQGGKKGGDQKLYSIKGKEKNPKKTEPQSTPKPPSIFRGQGGGEGKGLREWEPAGRLKPIKSKILYPLGGKTKFMARRRVQKKREHRNDPVWKITVVPNGKGGISTKQQRGGRGGEGDCPSGHPHGGVFPKKGGHCPSTKGEKKKKGKKG